MGIDTEFKLEGESSLGTWISRIVNTNNRITKILFDGKKLYEVIIFYEDDYRWD